MTNSAEIIASDIDPVLTHIESIANKASNTPGALLPVLHSVQDQYGYIPHASVAVIAKALNLSRADVHGVITFYHHFRQTPGGQHQLHICRAEACQSMGAEQLIQNMQTHLGIKTGETDTGQSISLDAIYCLGNCAAAPAVMLNNKVYGRVDTQRLEDLITTVLAGDQ